MEEKTDSRQVTPSMSVIAKAAGVSQPTVSRALADSSLISRATRDRIKRLAAEMGYRPDPALRALNARRDRVRPHRSLDTLAIIRPRAASSYCRAVFSALQSTCDEEGFRTEIFQATAYSDPLSHRELNRTLEHSGIRGVLLVFNPLTWVSLPAGLRLDDFIPLCVGGRATQPSMHSVQTDRGDSIAMAMKRCWDLGHRRIGLCLKEGPQGSFTREVIGSHFGVWRELNGGSDFPAPYTEAWGKENHADVAEDRRVWLEQVRPDCLLVSHKFLARGMLDCLPPDLPRPCIVWTDATRSSGEVDYLVVHDFKNLARTAVQFLEQLLHANRKGIPRAPQLISIPAMWYAGRGNA